MTELKIGVDYFPEHWPEERWARDVALMREAGMKVVRIAEFTWSKTQPRKDVWQWEWLDRAVDAIADGGLEVILCTPSACPPPWMISEDPSILPQIAGLGTGQGGGYGTLGLGHRRYYSPHHAAYCAASADCAARMAERWASHQAVIGYQIDNELCGNLNDVGPLAQQGFQAWLQKRHGSLETLDERLGLVFWSQQYDDWSQIPVPVDGRFNPGLRLEFMRFASEAWIKFCRAQADAMRPRLGAGQLLTTNCYLPYWGTAMDWHALMREGGLDVLAIDNYARSAPDGAFFNDLARSLSPDHWILEQQCGSTGGQHRWPDRDGRIKEDTGIAVAKGARVITYFRWRQGLFGNEQDHGAILDHHGEPGPIYEEVKACCTELNAAPPLPQPDVAVAFSWDNDWMGHCLVPPIDYTAEIRSRLAPAGHALGCDIRYAPDAEALTDASCIVLPLLQAYDSAWEAAILAALQRGATVIAMPLLFAKNEWGAYRTDYLSDALTEAFGVDISRRIPIRATDDNDEIVRVQSDLHGRVHACELFIDELQVQDATVVSTFIDGPIPQAACVTQKDHANGGKAIWCACYPDAAGMEELLHRYGS